MDRIDEIWKEFSYVCREFCNDMMFPELFFANLIGFSTSGLFIKKSQGVDILMQEDMKNVWYEQRCICFKDATKRSFVNDDDVGSNRVICTDEPIKRRSDLLETKHEATP